MLSGEKRWKGHIGFRQGKLRSGDPKNSGGFVASCIQVWWSASFGKHGFFGNGGHLTDIKEINARGGSKLVAGRRQ